MMKKILIIAFFLISAINSYVTFAGNETVEGSVFDGDKAFPDLTIMTSTGKTAKTNRKGYFKIKKVSTEKDTLFMNFTADKAVKIPMEGADQINVLLVKDTFLVQRKKMEVAKLSSSYGGTMVSRDALEKTGETNLLRAIALKVPGVEYVQDNLLIRGFKSFTLSNSPLYLVDGMETSQVAHLTVMEIESVEVVKDTSTSMFGVRGGNGVVIINRRK